ncbi:MAG: acyl-CoA reductase-like NAD-dependent aldehyde dehydrogenase [Planctomycetota bacterium]|jgi:acyl-CoA reductase-like NAD-dependent aldehyde dehydrogenase
MLQSEFPCYVAGQPRLTGEWLTVFDKFTRKPATRVSVAGAAEIEQAIADSTKAAGELRKVPAYQRQRWLEHCVKRFGERFEELAQTLCVEAGKPIRDSRGEVTRLIDTFKMAAGEAVRIYGEVLPLDVTERARQYTGRWERVPLGPCSFISPFNFPLNLVAHKVAPALAAGCPFVLKPASFTPVGALQIGEVLAELDMPPGSFSILPCGRDQAAAFTSDERLKLLSFTGSPDVGWALKAKAGKKKVVLELGGNAAVIVDEDSDLDDVCSRIVIGAFYQSGQSCIAVQRILIHERKYDSLCEKLVSAAQALKLGNPLDEATDLGPLIAEKEAQRLESWIEEAIGRGARLLCGGKRRGALLEATLLENVPKDSPLNTAEAFGPVACLAPFSNFDEALNEVNDSAFGLQAGVFTRDLYKAERAFRELEVGAVVIGDVPSWRVDHMPYGGVKDSGLGREGLRWSIEDMTEMRLMVTRHPDL